MIEKVKVLQLKPLKIKILGFLLILMFFISMYFVSARYLDSVIFLVLGILLLGYTVNYEINKDFRNYKSFGFFGFTLLRKVVRISFPEYISVFETNQTSDNNWSTVSALGTQENYNMFVVRFFNNNQKFTVYKSSDYKSALTIANKIGKMLDVDIYDATKE